MRLAESSRAELEDFFRDQLAETGLRLGDVRFHAGPISRLLVRAIRASGITVGRQIFLHSLIDDGERRSVPSDLAVHEICHVLQYERKGFFPFLAAYVSGYFRFLKQKRSWGITARREAYQSLPEEVEARTAENRFIQWRLNRRHNLPANWPQSLITEHRSRHMAVTGD